MTLSLVAFDFLYEILERLRMFFSRLLTQIDGKEVSKHLASSKDKSAMLNSSQLLNGSVWGDMLVFPKDRGKTSPLGRE